MTQTQEEMAVIQKTDWQQTQYSAWFYTRSSDFNLIYYDKNKCQAPDSVFVFNLMILISTKSRSSGDDLTPIISNCPTQWWHFSEGKWWHFYNIPAPGEVPLLWMSSTPVTQILDLALHAAVWSLMLCDWFLFFPSFPSFCFIWGRIVELFCPGPISPHWGVLTKCLAYSKAASDPFVYSLLRHQYRKTCSFLANKVLKRSPLNSSSIRMENRVGRSDNNVSASNNTQPPANKPQWRSSLSESVREWCWAKG